MKPWSSASKCIYPYEMVDNCFARAFSRGFVHQGNDSVAAPPFVQKVRESK